MIIDVLLLLTVWWISFTIVATLILIAGFGPAGVCPGKKHLSSSILCSTQLNDIRTGSLAAAFQAWMYGAFTPAAGVFATLTSVGMVGLLAPLAATVAGATATVVTFLVWYFI